MSSRKSESTPQGGVSSQAPVPPSEDGEGQATSPKSTPSSRRNAPGSWLSYAVPISIALIAILGAIVGYRVERHAANAGEYDQDALAATIAQARDFSDALEPGPRSGDRVQPLARFGRGGGSRSAEVDPGGRAICMLVDASVHPVRGRRPTGSGLRSPTGFRHLRPAQL